MSWPHVIRLDSHAKQSYGLADLNKNNADRRSDC
jgi:hypothetical protein